MFFLFIVAVIFVVCFSVCYYSFFLLLLCLLFLFVVSVCFCLFLFVVMFPIDC